MKNGKAGSCDTAGRKTLTTNEIVGHISLSRKEFFRDCIGRLLTLAVAMAAAAGSEALVDNLLRCKDRLLRGGRL